jgi:uncharacterized protein YbjT (DUF2867 family)
MTVTTADVLDMLALLAVLAGVVMLCVSDSG